MGIAIRIELKTQLRKRQYIEPVSPELHAMVSIDAMQEQQVNHKRLLSSLPFSLQFIQVLQPRQHDLFARFLDLTRKKDLI